MEKGPEAGGAAARKRGGIERWEGKATGVQGSDGNIAELVTVPTRSATGKPEVRFVAAVGEQDSEGQERITRKRLRKPLKRGEPHGREPGATNRHDEGGASRRSGGKPQGRNVIGAGCSDPKVKRWRHRDTGSGLLHRVRRRGNLWKTQERKFGARASNRKDRNVSGKTAPRS